MAEISRDSVKKFDNSGASIVGFFSEKYTCTKPYVSGLVDNTDFQCCIPSKPI